MKRSAYLELAAHRLGGDPLAFVRTKRDEGLSYQAIARELYLATEGKVDVSFSTVRNWLNGDAA